MLREAFVLPLIRHILSFEKLSIDSSSTSVPVQHITPVQHIAFIHCIICLPVQNLPHDSVCPDSMPPPRKTMTLYFTFPFSVIISARVLYALSCPIVSKPFPKRISYLAIPHPNTRRRQRPAPTIQNSMPPPLLQCHQGSAKMPPRPQIQKSGTCTLYVLLLLLLLPVCLPTCTYPPTFASPNAAFATSAPSVAPNPHMAACAT